MSSTLYRVRGPFPDAPSALAGAREVMRDLADWSSEPWPRLADVTTAEQYAYAVRAFPTARLGADREPRCFAFLDELVHRDAITFDARQPASCVTADVRLGPELADLWPLPEGVGLGLQTTAPFGVPGSEPEDDCTDEELDAMVSVLGPLRLSAIWDCGWRGLPESKDCGVLLCLNSTWVGHAGPSPGEFGVWISLGPRVAWTPEGQDWVRDCGLPLGEPESGW